KSSQEVGAGFAAFVAPYGFVATACGDSRDHPEGRRWEFFFNKTILSGTIYFPWSRDILRIHLLGSKRFKDGRLRSSNESTRNGLRVLAWTQSPCLYAQEVIWACV